MWFKSVTKLEAIPYVPPVAEQLAALPANEILVRGSDEPAAAASELVRPASDRETVSDELLRPEEANHGESDAP